MEQARKVMKPSADSWRMDEPTIKVKDHVGPPEKVVIDKNGANTAGINAINEQLSAARFFAFAITMIQNKYLNTIVEQVMRHSDHRLIKKITRPMLGFKSFASAEAILAGIELHIITRKGKLKLEESTLFATEPCE